MLTGQIQGTKKTHITVQDNIETTHLATGAPVGACIVLLVNGNIFKIRTVKQVGNILQKQNY